MGPSDPFTETSYEERRGFEPRRPLRSSRHLALGALVGAGVALLILTFGLQSTGFVLLLALLGAAAAWAFSRLTERLDVGAAWHALLRREEEDTEH